MVTIEKHNPVTGEIYHVFTKSIAGFKIFNDADEFLRVKEISRYYQQKKLSMKYSRFKQLQEKLDLRIKTIPTDERIVDIIAYCFMPTHIHLILKQLEDNAISMYMNNILNSYTRYFNIRHKRKGPLWEGRFKKVLVVNDEQLLHLTRYIHLNPVTSNLIKKPEQWGASSYHEYLNRHQVPERITSFEDILDIAPAEYRKFVEERKDYQQELKKIKDMLFD
ncbi:MAG: transposase [Candidatus Omnitrophota bacterium]